MASPLQAVSRPILAHDPSKFRLTFSLLVSVWRFAQVGFGWRTVDPVDNPPGIDRDEQRQIKSQA
jgi:hypothetical protein